VAVAPKVIRTRLATTTAFKEFNDVSLKRTINNSRFKMNAKRRLFMINSILGAASPIEILPGGCICGCNCGGSGSDYSAGYADGNFDRGLAN
jgi:hypothetical protein